MIVEADYAELELRALATGLLDLDDRDLGVAPVGMVWVCPACGEAQKSLDDFANVLCIVRAELAPEEMTS